MQHQWWFLLFFLMCFLSDVMSETDAGDMAVLNQLKKNMKNPDLLPWTGNDACGDKWRHVFCEGSRVTQIQVANLGLEGPLPQNLNQLSALVNIGFQRNNFTGPLPSLNGLQNLQYVFFDYNQFDSIPSDFFSNLPSLTSMAVDYNPLNSTTGWTLSSDITSSVLLQNLSLTSVNLVGQIPDFLGTMQSLQVLHLAYNKLTGSIPASFSKSNLQVLQLNNQIGSQLTGSIDVVGQMQSLTQLWLQANRFTGTIPAGLANALSLADIMLNDNQLVGPIPWALKDLVLTRFTVTNNHLDGPIPPLQISEGGVSALDNNNFCQQKPGMLCSLAVTALLQFLGAVNYPSTIVGSWSGNDPCVASSPWDGILCRDGSVSVINLVRRNLTGTISPFLSNLTSLTAIKLNENNLNGGIPGSLTSLKQLMLLDVSNNRLTGPIPRFSSHVSVITQGNNFEDGRSHPLPSPPISIPAPLPAQSNPIPPSPSASPPISQSPMVSASPTSPLVPDTSSLPVPSASIPSARSPAIEGRRGVPGQNGSGTVPSRKASSLPLSTIVGSVAGAVMLFLLLTLVTLVLYRKRRKLHIQSLDTIGINSQDSTSEPQVVKVGLDHLNGSTTSVHSREASGPNVQLIEAGNLVISVQVLREVTDNFSKENVLGRGGFGVVYKGELDDGTKIAVKRMEAAVISSKGLNEFQAEIAVLSKVRHRHLVALLGYCVDGSERLLVYEYMPQGPLSRHLFDWEEYQLKPLDWKKRLMIALDVARGMEYLHNLAHRSFIHRDLKPSNILLDDDFRAKVSDFGLVKLAPDGKNSVETRLAGTFGYLAPEYAVTGRITTKSDVFSFGVVLMELVSGRRALDDSQPEESMHLVSWFKRQNVSKESFRKAVDPSLEVNEETFQSICTAIELAGHCTAREPYQRPDMSHAVSILAPLAEHWKPSDLNSEEYEGIDLEMTLPQALKKWQAYEGSSISGHALDDSRGSLPTRPSGFADSFNSNDGR